MLDGLLNSLLTQGDLPVRVFRGPGDRVRRKIMGDAPQFLGGLFSRRYVLLSQGDGHLGRKKRGPVEGELRVFQGTVQELTGLGCIPPYEIQDGEARQRAFPALIGLLEGPLRLGEIINFFSVA
jgi:hypothetical protein